MNDSKIDFQLSQLAQEIQQGNLPKNADHSDIITKFIEYECLVPLLTYLKLLIDNKDKDLSLRYYGILIKVIYENVNDETQAVEICQKMIEHWKLSFYQTNFILESKGVISLLSPNKEADLFEKITENFVNISDRILSLERVAWIFHKKIHDDHKLFRVCNKILDIDPSNFYALSYKVELAQQDRSWDDILNYYHDYLSHSATGDSNRNTVVLELAHFYIFVVDQSQKALDLLEEFKIPSFLDTSQISYVANLKLGNFSTCHKILDQYLSSQVTIEDLSRVLYKKGELYFKEKKYDLALDSLKTAFEKNKYHFNSLELIIQIKIIQKDFSSAKNWIESLNGTGVSLQDQDYLDKIKESLGKAESYG
ncbi:MAG: hypothetical protein CMP11_04635 [Zetaproteobacteria bacterium]|nr:hypothetical protein [Pseudobdellovibrionaceae bacterium]